MDPNVTLAMIRRLAERVANEDNSFAEQLADAVRDLDGHLTKGGFLPFDWTGCPRTPGVQVGDHNAQTNNF